MNLLKKLTPFLFIFFVFFLQSGFISFFSINGVSPNLIFILFFLLVFFERQDEYYKGIIYVIVSGFLLDTFLPYNFSISIILLSLVYIFIKLVFYFLSTKHNYNFYVVFMLMFLVSFLIYKIALSLILGNISFYNNYIIEILYNSLIAFIIFYVYISMNYEMDANLNKL